MLDSKPNWCASLECDPIMIGELISHKVHGRRFIVLASIKILIGNWPDLLAFADLRPNLVLDAQELLTTAACVQRHLGTG